MTRQIGSIEILPEHGGHEIYRRLLEEFSPVCRLCGWGGSGTVRVWYKKIDDAMLALRDHLRDMHNVPS